MNPLDIPIPDWRIDAFRVMFSVACILKFTVALTHGQWTRLEEGSLGRYLIVRRFGLRWGETLARLYRPVLIIRLAAAVTLLIGYQHRLAAAIIAAGLAYELSYAHRFNSIYMALLAVTLTLVPDAGTGMHLSTRETSRSTWPALLVVILTVDLYLNSAWQKWRSTQFRSGLLLAQFVRFAGNIQHKTKYREFFYPRWLVRRLGRLDAKAVRSWRTVALAVIGTEALLPFLLLWSETYWIGVCIGIGLHLLFTGLLPRQLLGFSLSTVSTYLLFEPFTL